MKPTDIPQAYTGKRLEAALVEARGQRKAIAEGLIYEKTNLMIASDPGLGKSTISTQVAVELAAGLPVFGHFHVPRPIKVFYIQAERHIVETLERIEQIKEAGTPINYDNLIVTHEFQRLNLIKYDHAILMIECIERDCPQPELIIIDPIYSMVSGGLSSDLPASAFTKVMSYLQTRFGCALWLNHHTTKQQYNQQNEKVGADDRFYGSQWLKASVTGSYQMEKEGDGVILKRKKDNYGLLLPAIELEYDAATELCHVKNIAKLPAIDRIRGYLRACQDTQMTFIYAEIMGKCLVDKVTVRNALFTTRNEYPLEVDKGLKGKKLFRVLHPQNPAR